jgi:hypothetical protein
MRRRSSGRIAMGLALLPWLAACRDQTVDPMLEVAGELRALRTQWQERSTPASVAPTTARPEVDRALAPLRDAMQELANGQQALQARQMLLVQELQRWSQLLVEQTAGAARNDAAALTTRLRDLEAALQQQDQRHREVEAMLGSALDRTADRLEQFLLRLDAVVAPAPVPAAAPAPAAPADAAATPASAPPTAPSAPGSPPASSPTPGSAAGVERPRGLARGAASQPLLWGIVLAVATTLATVGCWRLLRRNGARRLGDGDVPLATDPGLDRLLAEARTLADPIAATAATEPRSHAAAEPAGNDEFVVLEDDASLRSVEPGPAPAPCDPVVAPATAMAAAAPHCAPPSLRLSWAVPRRPDAARAAALSRLAADPRVLRRPTPTVGIEHGHLVATFVPLPWLSTGEHLDLHRCLGEAIAAADRNPR